MYRLVQPDPRARRLASAERRRGQHADRSGQHGALIAEDVAEHVLRQYDVEAARIQDQLHRAVIDQQMIQRHIRIFGSDVSNYQPP